MKSAVILAGGSGLLGRALASSLAAQGHQVVTLTRRPRPGVDTDVAWQPDGAAGPWSRALEGAAAVVNLAGEGIADHRWTAARKASIRDSRLAATRSLVAAIRDCSTPPRVLVNASAVGFYGAHGEEAVTESTPPGDDFLAQVCVDWEAVASGAAATTRVATLRTGIVLDTAGGALGKMLLPFRLGLGATLGSGRQFMPWIHVADWLAMVSWIIDTAEAGGPFNVTAPTPVTNADFTRALGRALRRPTLFWAPAPLLRLALGEMAGLLLEGARVVPARATEAGFRFRFADLDAALADLLPRRG